MVFPTHLYLALLLFEPLSAIAQQIHLQDPHHHLHKSKSTLNSEISPIVLDPVHKIRYTGLHRNGIEAFLGVPYGADTSGPHRFQPPQPFVPPSSNGNENSVARDAQNYGPACPQRVGPSFVPLALTPVTNISEDCLNLNVVRPRGTEEGAKLPVMVWFYGGGFFNGQTSEITNSPDGVVRQSVEMGLPIVHVAVNYRLGVFGFARSDALRSEQSENAGLRDQRLALEWIQNHIEHWGGDPDQVTIYGQSSGSFSVAMHLLAYGGTHPVPFHRAIMQSQTVESGITSNLSLAALQRVADHVNCTADIHSAAALACLRDLSTDALLEASLATHRDDPAAHFGDEWLPSVDGDLVPAPPSELLADGRVAKGIPAMIGWCENDAAILTDTSIQTDDATRAFVTGVYSELDATQVETLFGLYPVSDFDNQAAASGLSAEFHRSARIFRDLFATCSAMWFGEGLWRASKDTNPADVFFYHFNQSILDPPLSQLYGLPALGAIHTSDLAYVFGNISHYNISGLPFDPSAADLSLVKRATGTWISFAATGSVEVAGSDSTFPGFNSAFAGGFNNTRLFVAGGPNEGPSTFDGPDAKTAVAAQKLRERCGFLNSPEVVARLQY